MSTDPTVIVAGARTPMGGMLGSLAAVTAPELATTAIAAAVARSGAPVRRIFLADGDAMTLSCRRLQDIMEVIRRHLPGLQRVSSYCLPRNLKNKTVEQLQELRALGLELFYVGCESGDDLVLERVSKGETFDSSLAALTKIKAAGAKSSVMILNGMGGLKYSEQHAKNSALLMNEAQPEFLATLVVSFPAGMKRFAAGFDDGFDDDDDGNDDAGDDDAAPSEPPTKRRKVKRRKFKRRR